MDVFRRILGTPLNSSPACAFAWDAILQISLVSQLFLLSKPYFVFHYTPQNKQKKKNIPILIPKYVFIGKKIDKYLKKMSI